MLARRLIPALVLLHYAAGSGAAVRTPPEIPEQPLIRTLYEWGDQIAAITEWYQSPEYTPSQLYVVDPVKSAVVPVRVPACDTYHDVAHDARSGKWILCGTGGSARVYRRAGESWAAASGPVQGKAFRFAVDGERVAIVSDQAVFLISPSSKGRPAGIPLNVEMPPGWVPSALLLVDDVLLLAYDVGEFGGGLYRIDLKQGDKPPTRLIKGNVSALARTSSGVIWAAGGLAHLSVVSAALYRITASRPEVVAAIGGGYAVRRDPNGERTDEKIFERAGVPFPGLTSLAGLSLGKGERPAVVLPELGVFELAGDRFVRLYEGALSFGYQMPRSRVGSDPVGLAIDRSGDLYVASRSLGILVLRKDHDRYGLTQLLFDAAGTAR